MKQRGFTLIELMIVVAIIGILTAIAQPGYQKYVQTTRRADAQAILVEASGSMERYFTENNSYANASLDAAAAAPKTFVFPNRAPLDGTQYYQLSFQPGGDGGDLNQTANGFTIRATPVGVQIGDGYLEYNSRGQKTWDENDDGDTGDANEQDWKRG